MTDKEPMNNTNDTTAPDLAKAPNGHGAATAAAPPAEDRAAPGKAAPSSGKKKSKKKRREQPSDKPTAAKPADAEPTVSGGASPLMPEAPGTAEPAAEPAAEPIDEQPLPSSVEHAAAQGSAATETPDEAEVPSPAPPTSSRLRLRMKVWTDATTAKRYLFPSASMRDLDARGYPISDVMYGYAYSADDTKLVTLRASEWNALPFADFQEEVPAPRASEPSASEATP